MKHFFNLWLMVYKYYWVKLSEKAIFYLFKQRFRKAVFLASLPITIRFSTFETQLSLCCPAQSQTPATLSPQHPKLTGMGHQTQLLCQIFNLLIRITVPTLAEMTWNYFLFSYQTYKKNQVELNPNSRSPHLEGSNQWLDSEESCQWTVRRWGQECENLPAPNIQ